MLLIMKMKMERAVIFDLFGTLVSTFPSSHHDRVLWRMAEILQAESTAFAKVFDDEMRRDREVGRYATLEESIEQACKRLGIRVERQRVYRAAQLKYDFTRRALRARSDAVKVLKYLKTKGYRIGLISDCPPEVPAVWEETVFAPWIEVAVFSCKAGVKKPDALIYKMAYESLEVLAEHCVYVGDGDSMELQGAKEIGMEAFLIRVEEEEGWDRDRPRLERWRGKRIARLSDLIGQL